MIFLRWKFIILIIVKYSHQFLTYLPTNITQMDIMLERMGRVLSNCQLDEMHYVGFLMDTQIPERWSSTFMNKIPTLRLKIPINTSELFFPSSVYYNTTVRYNIMQMFFVFISSPFNLKPLLEKLMVSVWWNPSAFYVIMDITVHTCHQPETYLSTAWNLDLKSSTYFCIDSNEEQSVYTYNYYGNPVPKAWRLIESSTEDKNRIWGLFKSRFQNDTKCEDVNLNKKINIGGFTVKLVGVQVPPMLTFDPQNEDMEKYGGIDGLVLTTIFRKMNATMLVTMLNQGTRMDPLLPNISSNQYDMLMNAQYIFNKPNITTIYPHIASGISSLTRPSGYDSNAIKILNFMNLHLIFGLLVVLVVTILVLTSLAGLTLSSAFLEIMRITINASVLQVPRGTPLRIYLITVISLFLITGSIFQSSLASILTSSIPKPNIDNNMDLKKSGYRIYMFGGYKNAIPDPALLSQVKELTYWNCSEYVIKYADTACITERSLLMKIAFENDLHMSKRRVANLYMAYITRRNFPLIEKFGIMLMFMSQNGLIGYWKEQTVSRYGNKWIMKQQEMKRGKYREMKINDLLFVFYILFLGLIISFITFLWELYVTYWKPLRMDRRRVRRTLFR